MDTIEKFKEGADRTPLSADVMNELVNAINPWILATGQNGIVITKSDGNVIISYDPKLTEPETTDDAGNPVSGSSTTGPSITCMCRYA